MFSLVSNRYERASMIVTSNKPFSKWGDIFGDDMAATAMIDRLDPPLRDPLHRGNATLNYRSVLARELTVQDAELYRRPGHRRRLRRVGAAGEGPDSV